MTSLVTARPIRPWSIYRRTNWRRWNALTERHREVRWFPWWRGVRKVLDA